MLWITACSDNSSEGNEQVSQQKESLQLESQLKNVEDCYLCGNSNKSMMSYYRQFDSIGLIALNEWYVLDFGLGIEALSERTKTRQGHNQGITYTVESVPSQGMSCMKVESDKEFDNTVIKNNLCQNCLDKMSKCVSIKQPFALVGFKT